MNVRSSASSQQEPKVKFNRLHTSTKKVNEQINKFDKKKQNNLHVYLTQQNTKEPRVIVVTLPVQQMDTYVRTPATFEECEKRKKCSPSADVAGCSRSTSACGSPPARTSVGSARRGGSGCGLQKQTNKKRCSDAIKPMKTKEKEKQWVLQIHSSDLASG